MPGGFVGVDVFFVISGYLITEASDGCAKRNRAVLAWLQQRPYIDTIVLAAIWQHYARTDHERF